MGSRFIVALEFMEGIIQPALPRTYTCLPTVRLPTIAFCGQKARFVKLYHYSI